MNNTFSDDYIDCDYCKRKLKVIRISYGLDVQDYVIKNGWSYEVIESQVNKSLLFDLKKRGLLLPSFFKYKIKCDMCIRTEKINKILKKK